MKRAHKLLVLVALALALTTILPSALAYFTDNDFWAGDLGALQLGSSTTVEEKMDGWVKEVSVTNSGAQAVFLRVKVFADVDTEFEGGEWTDADSNGWRYYKKPFEVNATETVRVPIKSDNGYTGMPELPGTDADPFEVTVVFETIPVQYDSNGNAINAADAKWDQGLIVEEPAQGQS